MPKSAGMRFSVSLVIVSASLVVTGCIGRASDDQASGKTPWLPASETARQCLSALGQTQARFTALPDRIEGNGCAMQNTVRIEGLASDRAILSVTNLGPVACPMAQLFAGWSRFGAGRAAQQLLGSDLVGIETMGSYACRNVAGSSRRSAHAQANAIDVSAFVLADGRRISVESGWAGTRAEREFLRAVHESACRRFGTVLGPNYNAAHRDHLHLEANGSGFCR